MKFFWFILFCLPLQLWAHGGEDHGDEEQKTAAVMPASTGSRAYASSELFELVLVAPAAGTDGQLIDIYLDYFADNSQVEGAVIELDLAGFSGKATMVQPGFYQLKAPALKAERHSITLTIEAGDNLDLLTTELDLTPASTEVPHDHSWTEYSSQLLLALGVLVLALLFWRLASRRSQEAK
ncbi:hypothetical protein [Rheinheimera sp. 4Y26]|uniref:hypothetical protein n=1 Tax=Rheinheimera sp. 4Y26 TaxID=2977811 RepID=UPI0021B094A6|nr:hypothetical protein [Rheinheimera sp. 4Y26]MCT6701037.1 hypothetical protein [Rheinheimera sp. 4Y26]